MSQHLRACLLHLYPACCCLPPLILFIMGPVLLSSLPQREGENSTSELLHRAARGPLPPLLAGAQQRRVFQHNAAHATSKVRSRFCCCFLKSELTIGGVSFCVLKRLAKKKKQPGRGNVSFMHEQPAKPYKDRDNTHTHN